MTPALTLFYSPRACSLACHIALEESGLEFTAQSVRVRLNEHKAAAYKALNPWGKIPALRVGDEVLTEAQAILTYIADRAPEAGLLPAPGDLRRPRAHEWMNFLSSTVHIAYRPLFRPQTLIGELDLREEVKTVGVPILREALLEVDRRLAGRTWALGDAFSVCDAYLLVFYIWSQREDVIGYVADMPNYRAVAERVMARPATQRALAREGLDAAALKAA